MPELWPRRVRLTTALVSSSFFFLSPIQRHLKHRDTIIRMSMITEGEPVPKVSATTQSGETVEMGSVENAVIYFYPKANTPGCTKEACSFRDTEQAIQDEGFAVYGVSLDTVEDVREFADDYDLSFPLLADPDGSVAGAFGVAVEDGFAERVTFVVVDGAIAAVMDGGTEGHGEEVLERIREL